MEGQTLLKVLSVGDSQSGKSCIIKKYCEGRFIQKYITTIGVDYGVKKMQIRNRQVAINFFDTSGDKDYHLIVKEFFKDAQGILLVVDLSNRQSFANIGKWEKQAKDNGLDLKKVVTYLVANKVDIPKKEVDINEVKKYAHKQGYEFMQTSAATGDNIQQLFEALFENIIDMIDKKAL